MCNAESIQIKAKKPKMLACYCKEVSVWDRYPRRCTHYYHYLCVTIINYIYLLDVNLF